MRVQHPRTVAIYLLSYSADMNKSLGFCLLLVTCFSALAGDGRLIGNWRSDKEATLAYLKSHTRLTAQQLDKVGQMLGKMTVTFTATNLTLKSEGWKFESPYKVVSETKDSVTLESTDPGSGKLTRDKYELDANGFWTTDNRIPGFKERFIRIVLK